MLKKIIILTLLFLTSAEKSAFAKTFSIALVSSKDSISYDKTVPGFRDFFKDNGFVKSKDNEKEVYKKKALSFRFDEFILPNKTGNNKKLIEKIKKNKYNLIVAFDNGAFDSINAEFKGIPIVFANMINPYGTGNQPPSEEPNIYGIEMEVPISVQFELLRSFVPYLQTIGVIYSEDPASGEIIKKAILEADKQKMTLLPIKLGKEEDISFALQKLLNETDALWIMPDNPIYTKENLKNIIYQALDSQLPCMGATETDVKAGALFASTWDFPDIGQQAAELLHKILLKKKDDNGKRILPLRSFPVIVNKTTAEIVDIRIPTWINKRTIRYYDENSPQ